MRKGFLMAGLALCMAVTVNAEVPDWLKMFKISG